MYIIRTKDRLIDGFETVLTALCERDKKKEEKRNANITNKILI